MKKLFIAIGLLLIFTGYSILQKKTNAMPIVPVKSTSSGTSESSPTSSGMYKDGSYTGDVADAYYGPLQVQVAIANGKITDVQFLQYPNDRGESIEISNMAMPQLKQEAIHSQNAQVDIVSGATQTSQGFQQSLQSALEKAKA